MVEVYEEEFCVSRVFCPQNAGRKLCLLQIEMFAPRIIRPASLSAPRAWYSSPYALMSLDFPKRSARKILERIIPPPLDGRDKLHPDKSIFVLLKV